MVGQQREGGGPVTGHEQGGPQRQMGGEVEGGAGEAGHQLRDLPGRAGAHRERHLGGREHVLVGLGVHRGVDGAQHLVPFHDVGEGRPERVRVGDGVQAQHERQVVGRGGALQARQEPQAPLGVRQRDPVLGGQHLPGEDRVRVAVPLRVPGRGPQRLAVDLPGGRPGQRGQEGHRPGDGRRRERGPHPVAQLRCSHPLVGDDEGGQPQDPVRARRRHDGRLADPGVGGQHRLHGGRVHSVPVDLHLVVGPPPEAELAVGPYVDQVAGPVRALPFQRGEPGAGQLRPAEVALGEGSAQQPQFAVDDGGPHPGEGVPIGTGPPRCRERSATVATTVASVGP